MLCLFLSLRTLTLVLLSFTDWFFKLGFLVVFFNHIKIKRFLFRNSVPTSRWHIWGPVSLWVLFLIMLISLAWIRYCLVSYNNYEVVIFLFVIYKYFETTLNFETMLNTSYICKLLHESCSIYWWIFLAVISTVIHLMVNSCFLHSCSLTNGNSFVRKSCYFFLLV